MERAEVERAGKKMKSGKASGVDGIVSEILKRGGERMLELTWKLCSEVFEAERVPRDWTRGLIFLYLREERNYQRIITVAFAF